MQKMLMSYIYMSFAGMKSVLWFGGVCFQSCNLLSSLIFTSSKTLQPPQTGSWDFCTDEHTGARSCLLWLIRNKESVVYNDGCGNDAGNGWFHRENCMWPPCLEWLISSLFALQHLNVGVTQMRWRSQISDILFVIQFYPVSLVFIML